MIYSQGKTNALSKTNFACVKKQTVKIVASKQLPYESSISKERLLMYYESMFIIITNTDCSVHEYEYVDVIEYDGKKYAVLSNSENLRIM